ncbi:MAG TPA: glycosyltransferase [Pyrinomonadaceae bacterium]
MNNPRNGITAIVTAFERHEQTVTTLRRILSCDPPPNEVIVHVDGNGRSSCEQEIKNAFPGVTVVRSAERLGPGGARNKLIAMARHDLVASFDDDSYPLDGDYFNRARTVCDRFPDAAIVSAALYHRGEVIEQDKLGARWTADFSGGACIYRRDAFLQSEGYVPLPVAYGMEEVDLALRLHARGNRILSTTWLRVFHDTDLQRHKDPTVTANSIANLALLAYLRYPVSLWWIGVGQCLNRVLWLIRHGRWRGVGVGVTMIPQHLRIHKRYRERLGADQVRSYLSLRRAPLIETL